MYRHFVLDKYFCLKFCSRIENWKTFRMRFTRPTMPFKKLFQNGGLTPFLKIDNFFHYQKVAYVLLLLSSILQMASKLSVLTYPCIYVKQNLETILEVVPPPKSKQIPASWLQEVLVIVSSAMRNIAQVSVRYN